MTQLARYIRWQIALPFIFFTLGLTAIMLVGQSLKTVDLIVNRGLSMEVFLLIAATLLPGAMAMILPVALFCAVIFAFYRFWQDSELIVMAANGISVWRLIRPALELAALCMALVFLLNLYVTPYGLRSFRAQIADIRGDMAGLLLQDGAFNSPTKNISVYVRERAGDSELRGILVYLDRDSARPVIMMAERGSLLRDGNAVKILLLNGNRQETELFTGRSTFLAFERYVLDFSSFGLGANAVRLKPSDRYIQELFPPYDNERDQRDRDDLLIEAHRRLSSPLYVLPLTLIAACGLLSGEYSRRGRFLRVTVAVIAGLALRLSELGLIGLASTVPAFAVLFYLVPLGGAAAALVVLRPQVPRVPETPPLVSGSAA